MRVPWTALNVAEITLVPHESPEARPREPAALDTLATDPLPLLQVASAVRSNSLESLNNPLAMSCFFVPTAVDAEYGVMVMATSVAAVTERLVEAVSPA